MPNELILEFWNKQAALSEKAGSKDLVAKQIEIAAISRHIRDGMTVCEFGCGNGITAIDLASRFDVKIQAFDFAAAMIDAARDGARNAGVESAVTFEVADVQDEPVLNARFDAIYTERMLINLKDWSAQERAIRYLASHLKPGGRLLLCENSSHGLGKLNELRHRVGLDPITPPWHNRYLDDTEVESMRVAGLKLVAVEPYSATYYFLSRVINAALAAKDGVEPAYDAPINSLALQLPPFGDCAQGKLWIFEAE